MVVINIILKKNVRLGTHGNLSTWVGEDQGFEYGDKSTWPEISDEVRIMLAKKYIDLFEKVTGEKFTVPEDHNVASRIEKNIAIYR